MAIDHSLHRQLDQMLMDQTTAQAEDFAEFLTQAETERTSGPNVLSNMTQLLGDLEEAERPVGLIQYVVFDFYGRPVYDTAKDPPRLRGLQDINEAARQVISQRSVVSFKAQAFDENDQTVWIVESYVPLLSSDGRIVGAVEIYLDMTETHTIFSDGFEVVRNIITLLALVIYVVPSFAFILQAEKRREKEKAVHDLSHFDTLTGLRNRSSSTSLIKALFEEGGARKVALYSIDIDEFSGLNKRLGTAVGDELLKVFSARLTEIAPEGAIIGRLGSDEFLLAIAGLSDDDEDALSDRILQAFEEPLCLFMAKQTVSVSIGLCPSSEATSAEKAAYAAGLALSHAKSSGRARCVRYKPDLDAALRDRKRIEGALRHAIQTGEVTVVYQPLISGDGRRILGFEALARLFDADGTFISPVDFIPVAETSGLIHAFGRLILREALGQARHWPDDIFISVNLSPVQFTPGDIVSVVREELSCIDLPASRLELELTENVFLDESESVVQQIVGLRDLGVGLAMDDFGTGYSSLGYLWTYDFDKLKIDRIFLENYEFDHDRHRDIIEAIVVLAHKMSMDVTVEGVENAGQVEMLQTLGVDQFQGYHYSKPLAPMAAASFIEAWRLDQDEARGPVSATRAC